MRTDIAFKVNGTEVALSIESSQRLIDVLRDGLNLTGTKEGCGEGECGACTVLVDGQVVNACLYPAPEIDGHEVLTIEGLEGPRGELSPLQQAFVERGAIQCGFCSPGMILASQALLDRHPDPSAQQIQDALVGNLCRCTGYVQIVEAIREVATHHRPAPGEEGRHA